MAKPSRSLAVAAPAEALDQRLAIDVGALRHHEEREQAVGDLACQPKPCRRNRAGVDRQRVAGVDDALQRLAEPGGIRTAIGHGVVHALVDDRLLPRDDAAHDRDVFPEPLVGLAVGDSVPALDHLRPRRPDAEDEAAARKRLQGHRGHGGAGRRARRHLHERGADRHSLGLGQNPGGRRHRVRAIGLGSPDRLVAESLRLADQVDVDGEVPARIAEHEPELQHFSSPVTRGEGSRAVTVGR